MISQQQLERQRIWKLFNRNFAHIKIRKPTWWLCDICNNPISIFKRQIWLDHDHKTGKFRGWLCPRCNVALGWFENRKQRIEKYVQ